MRSCTLLGLLTALLLGLTGTSRAQGGPEEDPTKRALEELKKQIEALRAENKAANDRLKSIEEMLASGRARLRSTMTIDPPPGAPPAGAGTGRLINRQGITAVGTLNGTDYAVSPCTERVIPNVPAGMVVYSVAADGRGVRDQVQTRLDRNEILTLTLR